jgi:hypothetical protein
MWEGFYTPTELQGLPAAETRCRRRRLHRMTSKADNPLSRAALAAGACLLAGALRAAESVSSPTLTLDPIKVVATPDYQPVEEGWQVGQVPGFLLFSHGNSAVKTVADQLQLARAAVGLVWSEPALLRRPMTVVITADEREFIAWSKVAPFSMDMTLRVVPTPAGPVLLVNGDQEAVHRAVGRGYVLAQLRDTRFPRWFQEGLAQVVNSAEAEGDRLRVGRVQQDPRNAVPLRTVRDAMIATQMSMPAEGQLDPVGSADTPGAAGITNARGDKMDIRINGLTPTWHELEQHLEDETRRRMLERENYTPTSDFASYLADSTTMSLEKVFAPGAPDTIDWRMNAWGFVHYSLFGEKQRHQPEFLQFVRQLGREPERAPVEVFQEAYKLTPRKFEFQLALYAKSTSYQIFDFKLAQPFQPAKPAMAPCPEANVLQLRARVLASTERAEEARQLLTRGYANPANRTPSYVSQFAALERERDPARAAELLENAARREQLDNAGRLMLAAARLERLRSSAKLSPDDLRTVLLPLFAALEKGEQSEQLFILIGQAWAASAVPPKPEHLNALRLGLTYYPKSRQLAELLKQLEQAS